MRLAHKRKASCIGQELRVRSWELGGLLLKATNLYEVGYLPTYLSNPSVILFCILNFCLRLCLFCLIIIIIPMPRILAGHSQTKKQEQKIPRLTGACIASTWHDTSTLNLFGRLFPLSLSFPLLRPRLGLLCFPHSFLFNLVFSSSLANNPSLLLLSPSSRWELRKEKRPKQIISFLVHPIRFTPLSLTYSFILYSFLPPLILLSSSFYLVGDSRHTLHPCLLTLALAPPP